MTENKRYELTFMDCFYITDHQTKDYSSVLEEDLEEVVNRLNEQHETIQDLLYQIGYAGKNNKPCRGCISYNPDIQYCTMYDMDVKETDIVVACENGDWKK